MGLLSGKSDSQDDPKALGYRKPETAAAQPHTSTETRETGWLIERTDKTEWFTGRTWTKDSVKAARFFSQEDAEWAIKQLQFDHGVEIKATEHIWS